MGEIIEWLFRELFQGLLEAVYARLPRPIQIGCVVLCWAVIAIVVGVLFYAGFRALAT